jgi:enoyl-CoA hydratase
MNLAMCDELCEVFATIGSRDDLRVVILRADGPAFCSGVDIRELQEKPADWVLARRNRGLYAFLAIEGCPIPVLARVHGAVYGAGAEMAAACDFIVATSDAVFQWPEALRGAVGATQRLARAVGRPMAKELLFSARKVDAPQAQALGLVNRVVQPEAIDVEIQAIIDGIERCGSVAVRLIKQAINDGEHLSRKQAIDLERSLIEESMRHDEWRLAVEAFSGNSRS